MFHKNDKKQLNERQIGLNLLNAIANSSNKIITESIESHDVQYMIELQKTINHLIFCLNDSKKKLDVHLECLNKETSA